MIKKTEEILQKKIKESEVRYRRLFESAKDGILILDSKTGQINDVNPFLEKLLSYSKNEFLGKKVWEVGAFKNIQLSQDSFAELQRTGYVRYDDLPLETKQGDLIDVEFVCNTYIAGDVLVVQCNIRDITERKKLEVLNAMHALLEEERLKTEFIANATHELRTPLAIIRGNVDLAMLKKPKMEKSALSTFKKINYEIEHLSNIVSDLALTTSKGGNLKNRIIYKDINLKRLIAAVIARSQTLASSKKVSIKSINIPPVVISGDMLYLEKMLVNLIKNSILYGKENGLTTISAEIVNGFVTISITDDGIGISNENLHKVFDRFYRVHNEHEVHGISGSGLGLSIVKWIVEIHGGSVSASSIEGKGSTFSVLLPIKSVSNKN